MTSAIKIENLSKKYIIRHEQAERYLALRDVITAGAQRMVKAIRHPLGGFDKGDPEHEEFWALDDVSLDIRQGERIGIIGRNGAGKSTLLKILSRITEPSRGRVQLTGRVASLLEVGTGFHPELTGRENIFLNGAILGMSKVEIRRKFDAIVDFAEVERFLDTPVKRYSSGMYVRLAFSVAAHLESDILIVDEVLAVGDAGFQKKCMGKMESVANEGRTILFVSHNMGAISELCTAAALLHRGKLVTQGSVPQVIEQYSRLTLSDQDSTVQFSEESGKPSSITAVRLCNDANVDTMAFDIADEVVVEVSYWVRETLASLQLTVLLSRNMIDVVHSFDTDDDIELPIRSPGKYRARYRIPGMFLKAGNYSISLSLGTPELLIQNLEYVLSFDVEEWSMDTKSKSYRRERPGYLISAGKWRTEMLDSTEGGKDV